MCFLCQAENVLDYNSNTKTEIENFKTTKRPSMHIKTETKAVAKKTLK